MQTIPSVELLQISKRFGTTQAVDQITLQLHPGEFFALLGASGCGKTTTLRLIGGLEKPDRGVIRIAGETVTELPPYARRANIVFQNYALFPHLTVRDNIAFGLRLQTPRVPPADLARRVDEALELVQLSGFGARRPQQLSGGQQQRVALARALVLRPQVLLLDEPLGALDRQLRKAMQRELRRIQQELQLTFLYVTHDQEEALSMSDRLAVMRQGRLEQIGTPQEVFETPTTKFVADFLGARNIFAAVITAVQAQGLDLETPLGRCQAALSTPGMAVGEQVSFMVRPEAVQLFPAHTDRENHPAMVGQIASILYLGESTEIEVRLANGQGIVSRLPSRMAQQERYQQHDRVRVFWRAEDCHVLREAP
jgi:spermidine/putrescine transport system ATP-binding protein